jgi:hypothetical protein
MKTTIKLKADDWEQSLEVTLMLNSKPASVRTRFEHRRKVRDVAATIHNAIVASGFNPLDIKRKK